MARYRLHKMSTYRHEIDLPDDAVIVSVEGHPRDEAGTKWTVVYYQNINDRGKIDVTTLSDSAPIFIEDAGF